MNVILTIDYNRYVMGIEDAAKVMTILGKARCIVSRYDDDAGDSYYQYEDRQPHAAIEQIAKEIRG